MALAVNDLYLGDCVENLARVSPGSIDLVFADPPFNIGYEYDVYHDARGSDEYLEWSRKWMSGVRNVLKPSGTFWLAIGDEFAAELKVIAQKELGFACRSWVIWYYTFGVNCKRGFSRSHTHLFHFLRDPRLFTFNAEDPALRVPSARQLVYADGRANPKGRLPDNTWILRPQDVPDGFPPSHDTWYFPRVAGTFKERQGFHGCQMPEQLLGRIIRCSSNPMDIVLDPFGGSGTTFAVAKKLGRQWIGFELSKDYLNKIRSRLKNAKVGDPLDGAADPLTSAPTTAERAQNGNGSAHRQTESTTKPCRQDRRSRGKPCDMNKGVLAAYRAAHKGFSLDHLLADPALQGGFIEACEKMGLPGDAAQWNRALLGIRKAGGLPRMERNARDSSLSQMDEFSFASEVAMQQLTAESATTLDGILCDPSLAARFDELARGFAPGYSSFDYRWAALALRKRAHRAKKLALDRYADWLDCPLPRAMPISGRTKWCKYDVPGVYVLHGRSRQRLYVGETLNVARRIELTGRTASWQRLEPASVTVIPENDKPFGLQAILIRRLRPIMNSRLLFPEPG